MDDVLELIGVALLVCAALAALVLARMRPALRAHSETLLAAPSDAWSSWASPHDAAVLTPGLSGYGMLVSVAEAPPSRAARLCTRLRSAGVQATVGSPERYGLSPVLVFPEDRSRALELLDVACS